MEIKMAFVPDKPEQTEPSVSKKSSFVPDEPQEDRSRPVTDVLNRGLVAGFFGAPVDIATMALQPFGYKEQAPFGGSEYIGRQMERAGMVTPTRRPAAEFLTALAPAALTGGAALGRYGAGVVRSALGGPAKAQAEALKSATTARIEPAIGQAETEAARAQRAIEQIQRQPQVAGQRAAMAPLTPEQEVGQLQAQVRQPVREAVGAEARTAEQAAARAAQAAAQAESRVGSAQQAVAALEQKLLAQPTMDAERFGLELRNVTRDLERRLVTARTEGSRLGEVIKAAGTEPNINTTALIARADELSRQTRNPTLMSLLNEVQSLAKNGEVQGLTLQQADSLRKVLHKDIINKYFPQTGADRETLNTLKELRRILIQQTPDDYKEALASFRTLSRPLDIVERQGALRKVVDVDPLSTAEKLTEAQVVGEIINKARAGNQTFGRLLEISPQLKESGRLYFTQDLFGKGAVPTEASLRTWLRNNERPLRQLGLYDEFRDIKNAREAANTAVENAKLGERAAKETAQLAQKEATAAGRLSQKSEQRLAEALQIAAGPTQKPGETLAEALRRTRTGEKAAPIQTFINTRDQQRAASDALTKMRDLVVAAKNPNDVQTAVSNAANTLLQRGVIDDAGYRTMLREVAELKNINEARDRARRVLTYFAGATGLGAGAVTTYVGTR
jgi:hypothetical protein